MPLPASSSAESSTSCHGCSFITCFVFIGLSVSFFQLVDNLVALRLSANLNAHLKALGHGAGDGRLHASVGGSAVNLPAPYPDFALVDDAPRQPTQHVPVLAHARPSISGWPSKRLICSRNSTTTVSYTHLRAHET